jgi:hypothetical protein
MLFDSMLSHVPVHFGGMLSSSRAQPNTMYTYATVGDLQLDVCQLNQSIQLTFSYRRSQSDRVPDQSIFYVSCSVGGLGFLFFPAHPLPFRMFIY